MRPERATPTERQDLLFIARLQSVPCYNEIVRKLTLGKSVRWLAVWLTQQKLDGPPGRWSKEYWQKLLRPLGRKVREAKLRVFNADHRKTKHPPPPTPEKIANVLDCMMDPAMQIQNAIPGSVDQVWKHVDATLEAVDAERILKFAFLQQVWRLDALMALEKQGLPQPNGHREMDMIRKIGLGILDLEMLHGHDANMAEPAVRKRSKISKKIITEVEEESGLDADDGPETAENTGQGGR